MLRKIPWAKWLQGIRDSFPEGREDDGWYGKKGFPPGTFLNDEEAAEVRRRLVESLRHDPPVLLPSEAATPPQPFRPPAFSPRHTYGGKGTIHQTSAIDVEVDHEGRVLSVWFRCMSLPFQVYLRKDSERSIGVINPTGIAIEEITYVDLPSEESSQ